MYTIMNTKDNNLLYIYMKPEIFSFLMNLVKWEMLIIHGK